MTGEDGIGSGRPESGAAGTDNGAAGENALKPAPAVCLPQRRLSRSALELIFVFVAALALRVLFNFVFSHVNNFASCDAFEYITNGQAFLHIFALPVDFFQKSLLCLCLKATAADCEMVRTSLAPLKDFYISGPVFPAFLAVLIALKGGAAENAYYLCPYLVSGNVLVSALSCVFITLIFQEAFGRRGSRLAGLLAAFYPGFIVNSGRLYSETFAAFLVLALSYITLAGFRAGGGGAVLTFLSGFLACCLQLTRSVMVVLTVVLLPLTSIQQKGFRRVSFLLPFILGFMLVALPWLCLQKLAYGSGSLVVDRVGHYNFFIGNNVDTQGWLSDPYPDGRGVDEASFPQLLQNAVKKSPLRWFRLMLDKPLRLFAFPWNDFRTEIGPWTFAWQVIFHKIIVLFGCLGLALALFQSFGQSGGQAGQLSDEKANDKFGEYSHDKPGSKSVSLSDNNSDVLSAHKSFMLAPARRQLYCRLYLALLLAFHLVYCLFITVPRYNLTAMPEIIIFAGAGMALIIQLLQETACLPGALRLLALISFLFILVNSNLLPFFVAFGVRPEYAWIIQAFLRIVLLFCVLLSVIRTARILPGPWRQSATLSGLLALAFVPLLVIPSRANGRYLEWYQNLSVASAPVHQVIRLPLAVCQKNPGGLFLLLDTDGVRQYADGLELTVNNQRLSGPILPGLAFAENFTGFIKTGTKTVQREDEHMWDALTNSAGCASLDLRQWSMLALPPALIDKALAEAHRRHSSAVVLDVSLKNLSAQALRLYGSYATRDRQRTTGSLDLYSWEKAFYGVENANGLSDTRYDIKAPAETLLPVSQDLSELPGLQNGVFNMAVLSSAPAAAGNSSHDSAEMGASGGMRLVASQILGLGSFSVSESHSASLPVNLSGLSFRDDCLLLLCLRGRSRVLSGQVCPGAGVDTGYRGKNSKKFTYQSAWSPRRLAASSEWKDFEIVVPVKPVTEAAQAENAVSNLSVVSPDSPFLNIPRKIMGQCEFAGLVLDVYYLPTNPIGLGHQVY